jgi:hypothetical protein
MKKRFEFMVILVLTAAFMSCPMLGSRAFAGEGKSSDPANPPGRVVRAVLQAAGKGDTLPDFQTTFPTTIQDLIDLVTNTDVAKKMQDVHDNRMSVREERVNKIKDLFGGGTPAAGN